MSTKVGATTFHLDSYLCTTQGMLLDIPVYDAAQAMSDFVPGEMWMAITL
jgi:hypothetical protein